MGRNESEGRPKRWAVIETYRGFGKSTRRVFAAMFLGGIALCTSLWLTDVGIGFTQPSFITQYNGDWLRSHAYIPNILAGITGFLIGVPVALVVLDAAIAAREDNIAIEKTKLLTVAAWQNFRSAAIELVEPKRQNALLTGAMMTVFDTHNEILGRLQQYRGTEPFAVSTDEEFSSLIDYLKVRNEEFKAAIDDVSEKFGEYPELQKLWSRIMSTWSVLNTYVRTRRQEVGLPWFNDDSNASFLANFVDPVTPLIQFLNVHHSMVPLEPPSSMEVAYFQARAYTMWDKAKVDSVLQSDRKVFGIEGVPDYRERANQVWMLLIGLSAAISMVDDERWPDPPA